MMSATGATRVVVPGHAGPHPDLILEIAPLEEPPDDPAAREPPEAAGLHLRPRG